VTREEAFDILLVLEEGYSQGGILGQGLAAAMMPRDKIAEAFQLLIDDGTVYKMISVRENVPRQYFMRFAHELIEIGMCRSATNRGTE